MVNLPAAVVDNRTQSSHTEFTAFFKASNLMGSKLGTHYLPKGVERADLVKQLVERGKILVHFLGGNENGQ